MITLNTSQVTFECNQSQDVHMDAILTGFSFGFLHVFSGPDHLAAVAPLSANANRKGWLTGLRWGFGHSTGVLVIGILALMFREWLDIELISSVNEKLVAIVLIGIGAWGLLTLRKTTIHRHSHDHPGHDHEHLHVHVGNTSHHQHRLAHTAVGVGIIHGLAGSSHLFGILPALAFPDTVSVILYLTAFTVGTLAAMSGFGGLTGLIAHRFQLAGPRWISGFMVTCSLSAVVVGLFWFFI